MKAIGFICGGSYDDIRIVDRDKPEPREDEVLVRIHAASINEWDWAILKRRSFLNGRFKNNITRLGTDVAGTVEKAGARVTAFKPRDAVMTDLCGYHRGLIPQYVGGAFAEYVCVRESMLLVKPDNVSFEQAACLPQAGALAIQGIHKNGQIIPGDKVLVNGASGGVGTLALQYARALGAEVTGVCSGVKMDLVQSLGANSVINYETTDFTRGLDRYDLVIDVMARHSIFSTRRVLTPGGRYIFLGGKISTALQLLSLGPFISRLGKRHSSILLFRPNRDLDNLINKVVSEEITPVVDRVFPLTQTVDAFHYYANGNARGKIVIAMV